MGLYIRHWDISSDNTVSPQPKLIQNSASVVLCQEASNLVITDQLSGEVSQHCGSCVLLNSWLLPTSYLMADLICERRLRSIRQAQGPNLSLHVYWYYIDLKDVQRAADYLIGNTSCVVLNFAWSHWPGCSFIIHSIGRKAVKWIHTCMHACTDN